MAIQGTQVPMYTKHTLFCSWFANNTNQDSKYIKPKSLEPNKNKKEKSEKYKNSVFVYIGTCVPWMAIETKFSKLCIICNLDEHLDAQLSK